jgi:hypothetical protein
MPAIHESISATYTLCSDIAFGRPVALHRANSHGFVQIVAFRASSFEDSKSLSNSHPFSSILISPHAVACACASQRNLQIS